MEVTKRNTMTSLASSDSLNLSDSIHYSLSPSLDDLIANIQQQRWETVRSILFAHHLHFAQCQNQVQGSMNLRDNESETEELEETEEEQTTTPLHLVCSISSTPLDVVDLLLKVYGTSCCFVQDEDGSLPIHHACSTPHMDTQIIRLLLEACPESSKYNYKSKVLELSIKCFAHLDFSAFFYKQALQGKQTVEKSHYSYL